MKQAIIQINGGLGKQVSFTALLEDLKNKYEQIHIMTPYQDLFNGNPYITSVNKNFELSYKEILEEDTDIFMQDPYDDQNFIKRKEHLLETWSKILNIENNKSSLPQMHYNEDEISRFELMKDQLLEKLGEKIIMFQFSGGQSPISFDQNNSQFDYMSEPVKRTYPYKKTKELFKMLLREFPEHSFLRFGLPNENFIPEYKDNYFELEPTHYKFYSYIIPYVDKIICIDSSLQHMAAANNKSAYVIWGETRPEHFGYSIHKDIMVDNEFSQPYFRPLGSSTAKINFPEPEQIIDVISKDN